MSECHACKCCDYVLAKEIARAFPELVLPPGIRAVLQVAIEESLDREREKICALMYGIKPAAQVENEQWTWISATQSWAPASCRVLRAEEMSA